MTLAALLWLAGCETTSVKLPDLNASKDDDTPTGSIAAVTAPAEASPTTEGAPPRLIPDNMTPSAPNDDLSVGKEHFRQGNYGMAERMCRRAVEAAPGEAEAWLCLAASYDRLKRFELADRAYGQVVKLVGRTAAVLNNIGYSYILRGDYVRARQVLLEARTLDPSNPYVKNNLSLITEATQTGHGVR